MSKQAEYGVYYDENLKRHVTPDDPRWDADKAGMTKEDALAAQQAAEDVYGER